MIRTLSGSDYSEYVHRLDTSELYNLKESYGETLAEEEDQEDLLHGRWVTWVPTTYNIVRIPSKYVVATPTNIFDFDKLNFMYNTILNHEGVFETPYGHLSVLGLVDIAETNKAVRDDLFESDYDLEEPWTTGDEDWDQLVVGWYFDLDDIDDLDIDVKGAFDYYYREWDLDPEEAQEDLNMALEQVDDQLEEFIGLNREGLDELLLEHDLDVDGGIVDKLNAFAAYLERTEPGDIGEVEITLGDGNHRAFAAIAAGEPYIFASAVDLSQLKADPKLWAKIEPYLVFDN